MERTKSGLYIVAFLALAAAVCPPAHAQAAPRKTTVLAIVASAPGADPSLREILQAIVRVQLARRKLTCVVGETTEPQTAESIRAMARKQHASYALVATYRTAGEQVELHFELRDAADGSSLSSASLEGRIDLVLDDIVSVLLDRLLADRVLRTDPAGPEPAGPEPAGTETARASGGRAESSAQASAAAALPDVGAPSARPAQPAKSAGRWRYLAFSAGAAPLLMAGPATDFSKIGVLGTSEVAVRIPAGGGALAIGVLSGFGRLRAKGVVTEAEIYLIPLGLDARYSPIAATRAGVSLHLSGGGALMRVVDVSGESVQKIVPFGLAGMALDLPFTAFFGLALEASFAAFYEASVPLLAFTPALSLRLRI
jgi:hypothetical protein